MNTLGDRIDRIVYISHLEVMNGERGYENQLNEIEDVVHNIEQRIKKEEVSN